VALAVKQVVIADAGECVGQAVSTVTGREDQQARTTHTHTAHFSAKLMSQVKITDGAGG